MLNAILKYWIWVVVAFGICMFIKPVICGLIIGSIGIIASGTFLSYQRHIKKNGIEAVGRILKYEKNDEGHKTPLIEYHDLQQQIFQEKPYLYSSTDASIVRSYKKLIGNEVLIKYDPKYPDRFVIVGEEGFNTFVLILLMFIGSFFAFGSIAALFNLIKIQGL